ncbi:MAG: hypothetical protein KatS3mg103_0909 [Phycisphaerales bacterium]|nr:MAG: hypothetical protein KatS3mg103_0909 [Phycisphaerales bacterium]
MQQAVRRASYPMVYRPTRLDRAAEAVASMEGLSADQRSQVEAVVLAAQRRLETIHRQMVEQIDRSEAQMTLRDMMRTGGRGNDDVRRLMDDRRQAIEQAIGQIRQVLGEELAQKLEEAIGPQRDEAAPRDGRPGRGGRLGNERPQRRGGEL